MIRMLGRCCAVMISFLSWSAGAAAQSDAPRLIPDCGGKFDLCGFVEPKTKVEVIPRRYERAHQFSESLAAVRIKGRFGFIDERGNLIILRSCVVHEHAGQDV